ncbi:MAG: ABC transporter permease [Pirellulales bacterium]
MDHSHTSRWRPGPGFPVLPHEIVGHFVARRNLIRQLLRREVMGRYDGSYLGICWSVLTPLALLAAYTFVFSVVFEGRWGVEGEPQGLGYYALVLFAGLFAFLILSEVAGGAASLVTSQPNLVTKVVFPLEVLPLVRTLAALVRAVPSMLVLGAATWLVLGRLPITFALLPLALAPMFLLALSAAYLLAFLGVFVRDMAHTTSLVIRLLTYLSPVFYPASRVPDDLRPLFLLNPVARIVEDCRRMAVFGQPPDWWGLLGATAVAGLCAWLSYLVFMSFKGSFADVV